MNRPSVTPVSEELYARSPGPREFPYFRLQLIAMAGAFAISGALAFHDAVQKRMDELNEVKKPVPAKAKDVNDSDSSTLHDSSGVTTYAGFSGMNFLSQ